MEIWKKIEGYPLYEISNLGRVRSNSVFKNGFFLKPQIVGKGYEVVFLYTAPKIRRQEYVHRLVANAFIANLEEKETVNHLDGNKRNNNYTNLEWATYAENNNHSIRENLRGVPLLNRSRVMVIKSLIIKGFSKAELARKYSVSEGTIYRALS